MHSIKRLISITCHAKLEKFVLQATHQSAIARFYGGSGLAVPTRGDEVALLATNNVLCESRRLIKIARTARIPRRHKDTRREVVENRLHQCNRETVRSAATPIPFRRVSPPNDLLTHEQWYQKTKQQKKTKEYENNGILSSE